MSAPTVETMLQGFSEYELLNLRTTIKSQITTDLGKTVTSLSTPGMSVTFAVPVDNFTLLRAINYRLWKINPTVYPEGKLLKKVIGVVA